MDKAKLWTNEGQPNNIQPFSFQKAALYATRVLAFPVGEAVGFCRLKRSLHAFPLPEKNSVSFIFSANPYVKPSPRGEGGQSEALDE